MIAVNYEVLRVGLSLNICLLDDFGDHWSSALDVDFERLMLHQCAHCPRIQSVVQLQRRRRDY